MADMMIIRSRFSPYTRAFSLIELLVAMTVTAILLVMLLALFSATSDTGKRAQLRLEASADASSFLDRIESDLRSLQRLPGTNEWLRIQNETAAFGSAGTVTNATLYLIARSRDAVYDVNGSNNAPAPGLPAAIRYSLVKGALIHSEEATQIGFYRCLSGMKDASGIGVNTLSNYIHQTNLAQSWQNFSTKAGPESLLSARILGFRVNLVLRASDGTLSTTPPSASSIAFRGNQVYVDNQLSTARPAGLDVQLEIIPAQLMKRIDIPSASDEFAARRERDTWISTRFIPLSGW